ncbi:HAD family hydrolase [Helicobacter kayseriensis]|uniref:HAD family hydrolase n=1 Tax=Helicobacter kayseriensis TaxID=2905877 RepID=UPI001E4BD40C|nr:HAD-IA family hydrolase [Helicobacter kayseriensis]MCE3046669.1 HAD-IA family hydrolase [Helicobacter kayseriensis]MCE3048029.1 HAD-IA family hydrolase [Helicobacter kayseriensis]
MRAYILDLDNTLYDENQYLYYVFLDFWNSHNLENQIFHAICKKVLSDEVRIKSKDIFKTFLEASPLGYSSEYHDQLFLIYSSIQCNLSLYPDAQDFLHRLKTLNIPFVILTNGPIQAQKNKILNLNIPSDLVCYAREFGIEYEKPHPKAFLRALDFLNLSPQHCYMIGDNPLTDIKGAHQVGITPIWLKRGYAQFLEPQFQNNKSIETFWELEKI